MDGRDLQYQFKTKLQQIKDLKNWNKQQLKCLDSEPDPPEQNIKPRNSAIVANFSNNEENSLQHFDEVPIKVSYPNPNDCLDSLPISNNVTEELQTSSQKPKFKFLKRGEGIARFGMKPIKIKKNTESTSLANKLFLNVGNSKDVETPKLFGISNGIDEISNLEPPNVKLDFKNWKKILSEGKGDEFIEQAIENNRLDVFNHDMSIDSSAASIIERIISVGRRHLRERKELTVFEAMEQHVLDSSFNSSSSYVARMMEQAVISTPVKNVSSAKKKNEIDCKRFTNEMFVDYINDQNNTKSKNDTKPLSPIKLNLENETQKVEHNCSSVEKTCQNESLHVRFADQVDYKSFAEHSKSFNSSEPTSTCKELNEEEECGEQNEVQDEWKEGYCDDSYSCSGCESTGYSSSDDDVKPVSPPETYSYPSIPQISNVTNVPQAQTGNCPGDINKFKTDLDILNVEESQDQFQHKESVEMHLLKSQLENEIKLFRAENSKLRLLQARLEKERKLFQNDKENILKELEEEKERNKAYIAEEKQKLSKEKLVFDKYCKSTKKPSREERTEMQALKEQLNEMKKELNKKESRWGAAQARVRNQVKSLEEDNNKLKVEVEVLRKKAKHLELLTRNKKGISNTKMIHAINEYLTSAQFEEENPSKLIVDKGYFEHQSDSIKPVIILNPDTGHIQSVKVIKENVKEKNNINELEHTYHLSVLGKSTIASSGKAPVPNQINLKRPLSSTEKPEVPQQEESSSISQGKKSPNKSGETNNNMNGKYDTTPQGNREVRYKNGTVKKIDPLTGNEKIFYLNGVVKEKKKDGTVKYYFSESRIWQTNLPDGLEILEHPNGQVHKRFTDGSVEIVYPNDCRKVTYPDQSEKIFYADGTRVEIRGDKKSKVLFLPNGQKEVHTDECIRREYPDGTTKTVYPDGVTQTMYSNGRLRLKDKHGNLIKDSVNDL